MQIQWFPGHMNKARKEMAEVLPNIDILIEVLDARIPFSSENPMLAKLRGDKPCIKLLNKSDLADPVKTQQWQDYLEQQKNVRTLAISSAEPNRTLQLTDLIKKMIPHKVGGPKKIHAMIVGIPNVGKSTIINVLTGRTVAKTGNEPAVTKGQQRINLDEGIVLFDTPGVLWPDLEHPNRGYRLATTGAIKDTAIEHDDVAFFAADFMLSAYPQRLIERFESVEGLNTELELLEAIGAQRGCLRGGGQVDLDKVSKIFINELRAGTLGRITLETPSNMEQDLLEIEQFREQKAAKKEARKQTRAKRKKKK